MREEHFDYVYCSDLGRAAHTFKHILLRNKSLLYSMNFNTSDIKNTTIPSAYQDFKSENSSVVKTHNNSRTLRTLKSNALMSEASKAKSILKNKEDAVIKFTKPKFSVKLDPQFSNSKNKKQLFESYPMCKTKIFLHQEGPVEYTELLREKSAGILRLKPLKIYAKNAKINKTPLREYKPRNGESWEDVYKRA